MDAITACVDKWFGKKKTLVYGKKIKGIQDKDKKKFKENGQNLNLENIWNFQGISLMHHLIVIRKFIWVSELLSAGVAIFLSWRW